MRVLFLTTQLPYPPHSGGLVKSFRLVEFLASKCALTIVCALKGRDADSISELQKKLESALVLGVPVDKERSASQLIQSYKNGKTLNEWRNYSNELETLVQRNLSKTDIVVVDHYEMFQYIPAGCTIPVVLHTHNAEHLIWSRYADLLDNPLKKIAGHIEARRIRKAEAKACLKVRKVLAAPADLDTLSALIPSGHARKFHRTFHLGNDAFLEGQPLEFSKTRQAIFFFGTLSWQANLDGLLWFIKSIWPALLKREPKLVFYIIGKNPPLELRQLAKEQKRIVFTGFVDDLDDYFTQCRVFINPVRFGSGIKVKMLDAMYRGMPTVSSSIGVESLSLKDGQEVMIADSVDEWVEKTCLLLHDEALWKTLSHNARTLARDHYRWEPMLAAHWRLIQETSANRITEEHVI